MRAEEIFAALFLKPSQTPAAPSLLCRPGYWKLSGQVVLNTLMVTSEPNKEHGRTEKWRTHWHFRAAVMSVLLCYLVLYNYCHNDECPTGHFQTVFLLFVSFSIKCEVVSSLGRLLNASLICTVEAIVDCKTQSCTCIILSKWSDSDSGQARFRQTGACRIELGRKGREADTITNVCWILSGAWTFRNSIIKENEKCYPAFLCLDLSHLPGPPPPPNPSTSPCYTDLPR